MPYPQARTEILIGTAGLARLRAAHVLVAGLGGVGGYAAEALGRAGIGRLTLLDHDVVSPSNLNRQLLALHSTLGRPKVELMAERLRDIDPTLELTLLGEFLQPEAAEALLTAAPYDYVADCIDSIACKAALVASCQRRGVPVISALGAGNCLDVTRVRVAPLNQTQMCPLARELRRRLRALERAAELSRDLQRRAAPPTAAASAGRRRYAGSTARGERDDFLPAGSVGRDAGGGGD
jgi:tRNA A37 threonylcarbamoyladenosine dehydratase